MLIASWFCDPPHKQTKEIDDSLEAGRCSAKPGSAIMATMGLRASAACSLRAET